MFLWSWRKSLEASERSADYVERSTFNTKMVSANLGYTYTIECVLKLLNLKLRLQNKLAKKQKNTVNAN